MGNCAREAVVPEPAVRVYRHITIQSGESTVANLASTSGYGTDGYGTDGAREEFLYHFKGRPCGRPPPAAVLEPATKRCRPEDRTHRLPHANDGDATFQPFGRNCAEGGQQEATGGAVIYTVVTDTLIAASYDLLFAESWVLGSFSAPTYLLCAPASDGADVHQVVAKSRHLADGQRQTAPGPVGGRFRPPSEGRTISAPCLPSRTWPCRRQTSRSSPPRPGRGCRRSRSGCHRTGATCRPGRRRQRTSST
jgi:hypothetical protein